MTINLYTLIAFFLFFGLICALFSLRFALLSFVVLFFGFDSMCCSCLAFP